jgi:N-methylhydantoinase A
VSAAAPPTELKVGVDIGGTFTDLVLVDGRTGETEVVKTFTTLDDPARGFVDAVDRLDVDLTRVDALITHGSTTAINTILTRTGAKVGFLCTRGHRDLLDIGRAFREEGHLYDASWLRPHVARPIVPRHLRRTVRERTLADGSILWPLDEEELRRQIAYFREDSVEIVAVCFINSYVNPAHEQRARELVRELWPGVRVELSSDIAPVPREYDRAITLALNAYVSPVVGAYLARIEKAIGERGFGRKLYVMQSAGGTVESAIIQRGPVATLMSGPVAGVLGAQYLAGLLGIENVLTFDMGGTSTDVAAISSGELEYAKRHQIEWDVYSVLPMVEINSVGQGGGSIAWIDSAGALRVGPQSAGALPGPACYGRGGTGATITDGNLLRGLLQADLFAGGSVRLDVGAARAALEALSGEFGGAAEEVAQGVYDIANANMMEAIRGVTIYKGIDPREYTLVCYGSAGGQHVSAIAGELGIGEIVVPNLPGAFSAFGLVCSDLKVDLTRSVVRQLDAIGDEELTETFRALEAEALATLEQQEGRHGAPVVRRFIEGYYVGQTWETVAKAPAGAFDAALRDELVQEFHATHERLWAFRADDLPIVLLNIRVSVVAPVAKPRLPVVERGGGAAEALLFRRPARLDAGGEAKELAFYERARLKARDAIEGPAAIVEPTTTTVLLAGDVCRVDDHGTLRIEKAGGARRAA